MCENESNSFLDDKKKSEYKWKELLYNLFYEIKSEILGTKIEIEEDEYQENIKSITIPRLVEYIHESIQILISNKIEISKNQQKIEDEQYYTKKGTSAITSTPLEQDEKLKYENIIKKLEEKERILYKKNFHHILQKEAMENKIEEYMEMEDEFEEMKVKLKYEDGRFLNNDRKDNEILIIRSENSNLKNTIDELEKKIEKLENLNTQQNEKIKTLNKEIKDLKIKLEEKQTELNLSQNYFNNITNHNITKNNNNYPKSKCILNHEETNSKDKINHKIKNYYKLSNGKEKEKDRDEHNNTVRYYRNQNMNLHYNSQFNKVKPKILNYKNKNEENTTNNDKKSTKGNTNNNDLLSTTRNEYTERLSHKFFSGNLAKGKNSNNTGNNNSLNKKKHGFPTNNSQIIYGKYSYLFNKKNNKVNNLYSVKKIISSGSVKSSRPNSTKTIVKKNNGYIHRSSSGE